jgi:hypothetical protein
MRGVRLLVLGAWQMAEDLGQQNVQGPVRGLKKV